MNISTGGPHILLFERNQQFVALLNSELQLAGYEIHTARTAVEVFDAIARYPVRLVLVNLAQAAAARREFWVALDTQRRGRGVQVFTFHCTNIAGYGPAAAEDPDERSHSVLADMEVDGMSGIVNMVNAIRSRIAVANTGGMSRLAANTNSAASLGSQVTVPILPAVQPPAHTTPPPAEASKTPNPNHTDKIRAVIYPAQRTWNTTRDNPSPSGINREPANQAQDIDWSTYNPQNSGNVGSGNNNPSNPNNSTPPTPSATSTYANAPSPTSATASDIYGNNQGTRPASEGAFPKESGLAQLSRMLQEHHAPVVEDLPAENSSSPRQRFQEESSMQQRPRSNDAPPISAIAMRASPIQDMPINRINGNSGQNDNANRRFDELSPTHTPIASSSPTLMSIATPMPPTAPLSPSLLSPSPTPTAPIAQPASPVGQTAMPPVQPSQYEEAMTPPASAETPQGNIRTEANNDAPSTGENTGNVLTEQIHAVMKANTTLPAPTQKTPDNALLLDIVQSLPPMPSPAPQPPQIHQGHATRSLGSVLLEGHLVPQNRLEVALNVQRMLRGVDMNYQLGEILLMFKLLTPDQLLAASLVSYGLITPAQISALGRIRQELHAIGLEYDLENLLILFRILTSEQLREVRSSWSG